MATLKDLSEYTGYSIATISRILNNDPSMSASEETRRRIIKAAETLNYAETKSKKGRNQKDVLKIGVVLSCPFEWRKEEFETEWLKCIEDVCTKAKISWVKIELGAYLPSDVVQTNLDGILAVGVFQDAQTNWIMHINKNVIFVDASEDELHYDAVVINVHAGMAQAVEHLKEYGHEQIGFFGPCGKQKCWTRRVLNEVLHDIYRDAMRVYGIDKNAWILSAEVDIQKSEQVMTEYINSGNKLPTAIIAASMENALGAINAFEKAGIEIPKDISIIAFCDVDKCKNEINRLTLVHVQEEYMCRAAIRLIGEKLPGHTIHGVRYTPKKVMIPPVLESGKSVAEPRICY